MSYETLKAYRHRRRAKALGYLGSACINCGSLGNLQFDHIDPTTKSIDISQAIAKGWSWTRLVEELDKCQLLCEYHHKLKTRDQAAEKLTHGKYHAAYRKKCSCSECIDFKIFHSARVQKSKGL